MEINFFKLHILRNDLILADLRKDRPDDISVLSDIAVKICDRHTGVGANGIVFIAKYKNSCAELLTFAPDGSYHDYSVDSSIAASRYIFDSISTDNIIINLINNSREYSLTAIDSKNFRIMTGKPEFAPENSENLIFKNYSYSYNRVNIEKTGIVFFPENKPKDFLKSMHDEILKSDTLSFCQPLFVKPVSPDIIQVYAWKNKMNTDNCLTVSAAAVASTLNGYDNSILINFYNAKAFAEWDQIKNEVFVTTEPEYLFTGQYYYDENL